MRRGPNRVAQNWRSHSTLPRNRGARAVTRAAVCLSDIAFGRPPSAGPTIAASRDRAGVRTGVPRVVLGDVPCASVTYRRERRTGRHRRVHHSRRARPRGAAETGVTAPWSPANDGRPVCVGLQAAGPTLQVLFFGATRCGATRVRTRAVATRRPRRQAPWVATGQAPRRRAQRHLRFFVPPPASRRVGGCPSGCPGCRFWRRSVRFPERAGDQAQEPLMCSSKDAAL